REDKKTGAVSYELLIKRRPNVYRLCKFIRPYLYGEKLRWVEKPLSVIKDASVAHKKSLVSPIRYAEYAGQHYVYDLHIDNQTHLFLVEGFVQVHNSEPITQGALGSKHCISKTCEVLKTNGETVTIDKIKPGDEVFGIS